MSQDNPETKSYRVIDDSSMTVPDQSMTIQEIMYRASHGLPTTGAGFPLYDDEDEPALPNDYDLTDLKPVYFDENDAKRGINLNNFRQRSIIDELQRQEQQLVNEVSEKSNPSETTSGAKDLGTGSVTEQSE